MEIIKNIFFGGKILNFFFLHNVHFFVFRPKGFSINIHWHSSFNLKIRKPIELIKKSRKYTKEIWYMEKVNLNPRKGSKLRKNKWTKNFYTFLEWLNIQIGLVEIVGV